MKQLHLLNALELLIQERNIITPDALATFDHDELTNIIAEFLESTYLDVGMAEIERRISHAMKIDIESIENGLELMKNANPTPITIQVDDPYPIDPEKSIQDLEKFICRYKEKSIDRLNALFNLEFFYDSSFDRILMCFSPTDDIFVKLQSLLNQKLNNLSENDALLYWAKIKASFGNDPEKSAYRLYDDIIPINFFSSDSSNQPIREKCAIVLSKYKPLTIRKMLENGIRSIPIGLAGVAKILSLTNMSDISPITSTEALLARASSQLIATYESLSGKERSKLAKMVGADESGFIFNGDFYRQHKQAIDSDKIKIKSDGLNKLLMLNAKRLHEYTNLQTQQQTKIENALFHYKLGQEVIHPARYNEFKNNKKTLEVYLQKDMCKFLMERNISVYGKSIGRSLLDLYHQDISGDDYVIEAKRYDNYRELTLKNIKENVVQLQSYMDQHKQARGILAIYNFTPTLLMVKNKWFHGRIWILSINLCEATPSKRNSSIEIIESKQNVIDLITIE
jgi:hypothetical protein